MHNLHPTGFLKLSFGSNWVKKTKASIYEILKMVFSNIDFNLLVFLILILLILKLKDVLG